MTYWSQFHLYFPGLRGSDLLVHDVRQSPDAAGSFALGLQRTGGILHFLVSSKGRLCYPTNSKQQDCNLAVCHERLLPG